MTQVVREGKLRPGGVSLAVGCAALCALGASGCGEAQRNGREAKASYAVEVVRASFPKKQAVARDTRFALVVRNSGSRTIPNVAVTLDSFYYTSTYPHLAANKRPVWIVNTGPGAVASRPVQSEEIDPPGGGETAFVNTWALGPLAAGKSRLFSWLVTPVKAGVHKVRYTVAAGLDGNASARLASGEVPTGSIVAQIAPRPPATHVNPETGRVASGAAPASQVPVGAVP